MIDVRPGMPGDGALIAQTRQKCWATTYRGIFPDEAIDSFDYAWHTERDEARLARGDFHYILMMDGPECVGYCSYGLLPEGRWRNHRFQLQSLYLLEEYRGRGIGTQMMEQVFRACRAAGYDRLFWECSPHNLRAIRFYERMGAIMTQVDLGHENRQEDACYFEFNIR